MEGGHIMQQALQRPTGQVWDYTLLVGCCVLLMTALDDMTYRTKL